MESGQKKLIESEEAVESYSLADILKLVSYGSELREAVERIAKSHRGALIVLSEKAREIAEGGFGINSKFTAQRLAELAKMDGAIIVDSKLKKILYTNTLLVPNPKIKSKETGSKHKAAERTAKQLGVIVVVVSEKSSMISVYYGDKKYLLNDLTELLYKSRETIENLESQKEELEISLKRFDSLEISSLVSLEDLAYIIDKIVLFFKDCENASIYIAELGKHNATLRTRYNFVISGLREDLNNIERDYERYFYMSKVIKTIKSLKIPTIEQSKKILLSYAKNDLQNNPNTVLMPPGYRILSRTQIEKEIIENLVNKFKNIKNVFYADVNDLMNIEKFDEKKAKLIKDFLTNRIIAV